MHAQSFWLLQKGPSFFLEMYECHSSSDLNNNNIHILIETPFSNKIIYASLILKNSCDMYYAWSSKTFCSLDHSESPTPPLNIVATTPRET